MTITRVTNIDNRKHIALLDTSSISFMNGLETKGISSDDILKDYDLILIPKWVLMEINDAEGRKDYLQKLIVLASTYQIARIRSYLRRFVEKNDILDMEAYKD